MTTSEPVLHLSERQLRAMTADLDAIHHDVALPALKSSLSEWTDDIHEQAATRNGGKHSDDNDRGADKDERARRIRMDRRGFLAGAGGVAGVAILAACSSSSSTAMPSGSTASGSMAATGSASAAAMTGGEGQMLTGDLRVVGMAASLENSGIATYMAGIKAATAGKLGTVPPAVVTFAKTAMAQHKDHQQAWNAVLSAAGKQPVTAVDPVIQPVITTAFAKVNSVTGLAELALLVENIAGETYQNGLSVIKSAAGIKTAASIEPVEFQHAAILSFILGKYPVPNSFTGLSDARPPTDYS